MSKFINNGKAVADFTPKSMPDRTDKNAATIDMDFNGLSAVVRSHSDRIAALAVSMYAVSAAAGGSVSGANPSASVGLAAVNGSASTFMRSDAAPALSQSIAPTWSALHTFTLAPKVSAFAGGGTVMVSSDNSGQLGTTTIPGTTTGDLSLRSTATAPSGYTYTGKIFDRTFPWVSTPQTVTGLFGRFWANYNGIFYVGGGDTGGAASSIFTAITFADISSVNKLGVPTAYQYQAGDSDGAGLIYACGGASHAGTAVTDLFVYNVGANTWATPAGVMPGVRWKHCAVIYSGNMYVFGGANNGPALVTQTYTLNLAGASWISTNAAMTTARIHARCAVVNGKIYVIGGNTTTGTVAPTAVNECYDVAGNSWSTKAALPVATSEGQIVVSGNLIMYIGGNVSVAGVYKTTRNSYIYDTVSDIWYRGPSLVVARSSGSIGISGTDLLISGGQTTIGTAISSIEASIFPQEPTYLMSKN